MTILVLKFQEETSGIAEPAQSPSPQLAAQRPQVLAWVLSATVQGNLSGVAEWWGQSWVTLRSLCVLNSRRCCCWERQGLGWGPRPLKWLPKWGTVKRQWPPCSRSSLDSNWEHRPVLEYFLMKCLEMERPASALAPLILSLTSHCLDTYSTTFLELQKSPVTREEQSLWSLLCGVVMPLPSKQ